MNYIDYGDYLTEEALGTEGLYSEGVPIDNEELTEDYIDDE